MFVCIGLHLLSCVCYCHWSAWFCIGFLLLKRTGTSLDQLREVASKNHKDNSIRQDFDLSEFDCAPQLSPELAIPACKNLLSTVDAVSEWDLALNDMESLQHGHPILLDRATDHFEECSRGIFLELLPHNLAMVALAKQASCVPRMGVIPLELLCVPKSHKQR